MKKQTKKQKRNLLLLVLILIIVLVGTISLNLYLFSKKPLDSLEIQVKAQVGDKLGMSATTEELDFGMTKRGYPIDKFLVLKNNYNFPVRVEVILTPEIKDIIFGKDKFYLESGEELKYTVSFYPLEDTELGNYSGKLTFNFFPAE